MVVLFAATLAAQKLGLQEIRHIRRAVQVRTRDVEIHLIRP